MVCGLRRLPVRSSKTLLMSFHGASAVASLMDLRLLGLETQWVTSYGGGRLDDAGVKVYVRGLCDTERVDDVEIR
jgi:hypothetical protein